MGASVVGSGGVSGGGVGWPSRDQAEVANAPGISRRMLQHLCGNPFNSVTANNSVNQNLIDGVLSSIAIPNNFCDVNGRGVLAGAIRSRSVMSITNTSGTARTISFGWSPINATGVNFTTFTPVPSDGAEYLYTLDDTFTIIGGTKLSARYMHVGTFYDGTGQVAISGGGVPVVRQYVITSLKNISVQPLFPLMSIFADLTTALCTIKLYSLAIEVMPGQSSIGL